MLNNITNFFNLIAGKAVKSKLDPEDLIPIGSRDSRYGGNYRPTAIPFKELQKQLGTGGGNGGSMGTICDITMEQKGTTFGPAVTVTYDFFNQLPPFTDVLIPGQLELTWDIDLTQFINPYSPLALEWNSQWCAIPFGHADLSDVESRTYCSWSYFFLNSNDEFVLHDPATDTYWKILFHYFNFKFGYSYTREQIFPADRCKLTFSDGTVLDTVKDLVVGSSVTQTVNPDGTVTYSIGTSDIPYSDIAFVDPIVGNDMTAQLGVFNKPYQSVSAAINASVPGASSFYPKLVVLRKGNYSGLTMQPNVHVYCEPGVDITSTLYGNSIGSGQYSKFFGFARFNIGFGWAILMDAASASGGRLDIEFDSMESGGFLSVNYSPILKIKCNYVRCSGLNGAAYCVRVADTADVTFDIREYFHAQHTLFFLRRGSANIPFNGRLVVNCPELAIIPTYTSNYGNVNTAILQSLDAGAGTVIINGESRINRASTSTPAYTFQTQATAPTIVEINGNVYGRDNHCIWTGYQGWLVDIRVNGDLISNISPINCYLNNTNVDPGPSYLTVRNSKIIGYANILGVSRYIKFMNCSFYQYADGVLYPTAPNITWQNDQLGQVKRADFYNCIAEANGASAEFMEHAGTGLTEITLVGCYGNKPVGTGLVPTFSDYVQVPSLKVLNRV